MGAIAPIDFEDPNITLPFEGCKSDKFTSKIAISTHRFEFLKTPLDSDTCTNITCRSRLQSGIEHNLAIADSLVE